MSRRLPSPDSAILTSSGFRAAVAPVLPSLTSYARRLASNGADMEDLVQDTLLKAWSARTSFMPGSNLKAWLMRIARNTFLSGRRSAGRQVLWEPEDIARALVTTSEQETAVMLDDLDSAVSALPVHQQRAFELVMVENLSYEDAANRLGVELGTLKSQLSRARATLARAFDQLPEPARPADPPRVTEAPARSTIYARWKASGSRMIGGSQERVAA